MYVSAVSITEYINYTRETSMYCEFARHFSLAGGSLVAGVVESKREEARDYYYGEKERQIQQDLLQIGSSFHQENIPQIQNSRAQLECLECSCYLDNKT